MSTADQKCFYCHGTNLCFYCQGVGATSGCCCLKEECILCETEKHCVKCGGTGRMTQEAYDAAARSVYWKLPLYTCLTVIALTIAAVFSFLAGLSFYTLVGLFFLIPMFVFLTCYVVFCTLCMIENKKSSGRKKLAAKAEAV
mmetsp:Transcript_4534/g.5572  ORF Transcript_4534/g.5572 Transcript_4534/m.5572 type:complete len:142 (+) Transcript_4534:1125-1550(+)